MRPDHPNPIDDARLESLVEEIGDRDLVLQTVQMFLDELPARVATITASVATGDRAQIKSAAHALGSPAAMLGVTSVAHSTRELQNAVSGDEEADLAALLDAVVSSAHVAADALRRYLTSGSPS